MTSVDGHFRRHHRVILATLVRLLGPKHFDLAEDVAQEALVRALEVWPFSGVPANPAAWLIQTAKRKAIDRLRRDRRLEPADSVVAAAFDRPSAEFSDDMLAMMFLCCHPSLTIENQVALTLQAVCGLKAREIAQAFLLPEATVAQRLVRAKRALAGRSLEAPSTLDEQRVGAVLAVLYLLFNEGYASLRIDLCEDAIALTRELAAHPRAGNPAAEALLALMLFQSSRLDAREPLLTLAEQDRSRWNRARIAEAFAHFERSIAGPVLTRYHVEAIIAAQHAQAVSFEQTDWAAIAAHYDTLLEIDPGPAAALNRAIAIGFRDGPLEGIAALHALVALGDHHRYHAALGAFWRLAGNDARAVESWRRALELAVNPRDREFHAARLAAIEGVKA